MTLPAAQEPFGSVSRPRAGSPDDGLPLTDAPSLFLFRLERGIPYPFKFDRLLFSVLGNVK